MKRFLSRLGIHFSRLRGAMRFGIPYFRAATFKLPGHIRLNGADVSVLLPDDTGIRSDVLGCLMEDVYGLGSLRGVPSSILDIGANVGLFCLAARSYFPDARIHGYEPNPRTLPYLEHQSRAAGFMIFPEAVGDRDASVAILDGGDSNLARTVECAASGVSMTMVSLSKAVARLGGTVDLAKIDCEGAEWLLFKDREAWSKIAEVRMEYHLFQGETFEQLASTLGELGFHITKHLPSGNFGLVWCSRSTAASGSA
jgi:FkbM family methyltransferase